MAEEKTGVAKHSADYRARKKAMAEKLGIEKVFFNMPAGIKWAMAAEIEHHGYARCRSSGRTWLCRGLLKILKSGLVA